MKFRFGDSVASYTYAIFLVSFLGHLIVYIPFHVIALKSNGTSGLTEAYLGEPSVIQYNQPLSSSVPDPSSINNKEDNEADLTASTIPPSSSSNAPITTQDSPLPAAVLNQGTLSDQLVEPAAAVVTLAEEATATLQQRAASQSLDAAPTVTEDSNTTGKPSPIDSALPPVILLPGSSNPPPVVRALPKVIPPKQASEPPPKDPQVDPSTTTTTPPSTQPDDAETTSAPPAPPPAVEVPQEDIPSFSEWTQKQLEEAEKKKTENRTASPGTGAAKLRSKNYASPDCGAKVVATNPEAENPSGVLSSSRDDYLINTCTTTRQWIVIELCEAIQAKKLELANLELFSSSPKEFSVSLSRTFPTREWSSLGHFTAKDERTIQTFALQPLLFGKFIRVDFHSHYGNEHFCCTTLIRVYGTSEFEVLETEEAEEDDHHGPPSLSEDDEDEDYEEGGRAVKPGKPRSPKNLFGHATEAVFSIVKKAAAAVLVTTGGAGSPAPKEDVESSSEGDTKSSALCCASPRHIVVCNNCSDETFCKVFELLSCQRDALTVLAGTSWIRSTLGYSRVCSDLGLDVLSGLAAEDVPKTIDESWELLQATFSDEYIAAMCNVLAVEEHKVAVNMSRNNEATYLEASAQLEEVPSSSSLLDELVAQTCSAEPSSATTFVSDSDTVITAPKPDIRPTKTIKKEQSKVVVAVETQSGDSGVTDPSTSAWVASTATVAAPTAPTPPHNLANSIQASAVNKVAETMEVPEPPTVAPESVAEPVIKPDVQTLSPPPVAEALPAAPAMSADSEESQSEEYPTNNDFDALFTEINTLEQDEQAASTPPTPRAAAQGLKESVFLRLSNKIKALDRNMSLSGQYLEELSRRYKKQEELGRALNKSLAVLWEESRRARSREQQAGNDLGSLREKLDTLSAAVDMLLAERNSWRHRIEHCIIILIEMSIFGLIFWTCRRLPADSPSANSTRKWSTGWKKSNGQNSQKSQSANRVSTKRRNSFDGRNSTPPPRKRRPSEEAINVTGSYIELVQQNQVSVNESNSTNEEAGWMVVNRAESRRQQKKRRKNLLKSSSTHNLVNIGSSSLMSYYMPDSSTPIDEKDPQRRISVPAKVALNASGESHSGPPSQGGMLETEIEDVVNVSPPTFIQTAASARSRRSVSSVPPGGDAASARPATAMTDEAPAEAEKLSLAYLPSQTDLNGVTYRTAGGSDSPGGSVSSKMSNLGNGESSKKTKKRGLKSMVKKLF